MEATEASTAVVAAVPDFGFSFFGVAVVGLLVGGACCLLSR